MSVATSLGSERNLLEETPEHAHQLVLDQPILRNRELETLRHVVARRLQSPHDRHHLAGRGGRRTGWTQALDRICRRGRRRRSPSGVNIIDPLRPRRGPAAGADPVAAGGRRRAPPPRRARARGCRRASSSSPASRAGPPHRDPDRLRRQRRQPVADARDARRARARGAPGAPAADGKPELLTAEQAAQNVRQGDRQGPAEDDLEDGHLDDPVLLRRADLRGGRASSGRWSTATSPAPPRASAGSAVDVLAREALERHARAYPTARGRAAAGRRRLRVAARRRAPHVEPGHDRAAPARGARANGDVAAALRATSGPHGGALSEAYETTASTRGWSTRTPRAGRRCAACLSFRRRPRRPDPARGGRAGERDRQALLHRRDEPRLDLARGARDPGDRDEPARRPVEHRRGRRGPRRASPDANGDRRRSAIKQVASGRFGVTIDYLVNADELQIKMAQGAKPGEGGQLPGPQGRRLHRLDPPHDARRRADLAAAAPRHLLDRGPQAADLRPALREPRGADLGQARRPRSASAPSPRASAKANADHVLISGHDGGTGASPLSSIQAAGIPWEIGLAETQQTLLLQRPALAHLGADRRPAEDRPRRRDRRDARRRRDGLRDGAADRDAAAS